MSLTLTEVIRSLLKTTPAGSHRRIKLKRGLYITYTPADPNDPNDRHHLAARRNGAEPGDQEIEIVIAEIKSALKQLKRPYTGIATTPTKRSGNQYYVLISWRQPQQLTIGV
jgi:hypothetical protein